MIKNVFQLHERLNLTYNEIFDISFQNIQIAFCKLSFGFGTISLQSDVLNTYIYLEYNPLRKKKPDVEMHSKIEFD